MLGETVKVDKLTQPYRWADLEPGDLVAVPNQCWDYDDPRWTVGAVKNVWDRPPRGDEKTSKTHHVRIEVSDHCHVWITRLSLLRVITLQ